MWKLTLFLAMFYVVLATQCGRTTDRGQVLDSSSLSVKKCRDRHTCSVKCEVCGNSTRLTLDLGWEQQSKFGKDRIRGVCFGNTIRSQEIRKFISTRLTGIYAQWKESAIRKWDVHQETIQPMKVTSGKSRKGKRSLKKRSKRPNRMHRAQRLFNLLKKYGKNWKKYQMKYRKAVRTCKLAEIKSRIEAAEESASDLKPKKKRRRSGKGIKVLWRGPWKRKVPPPRRVRRPVRRVQRPPRRRIAKRSIQRRKRPSIKSRLARLKRLRKMKKPRKLIRTRRGKRLVRAKIVPVEANVVVSAPRKSSPLPKAHKTSVRIINGKLVFCSSKQEHPKQCLAQLCKNTKPQFQFELPPSNPNKIMKKREIWVKDLEETLIVFAENFKTLCEEKFKKTSLVQRVTLFGTMFMNHLKRQKRFAAIRSKACTDISENNLFAKLAQFVIGDLAKRFYQLYNNDEIGCQCDSLMGELEYFAANLMETKKQRGQLIQTVHLLDRLNTGIHEGCSNRCPSKYISAMQLDQRQEIEFQKVEANAIKENILPVKVAVVTKKPKKPLQVAKRPTRRPLLAKRPGVAKPTPSKIPVFGETNHPDMNVGHVSWKCRGVCSHKERFSK